MLTTRYIKNDLKIFMNRKCNSSFVILCVRETGKKDRTAMLISWKEALRLVEEWTGLLLTREDFEEDDYVYPENKKLITEEERKEQEKLLYDEPTLF